MRVVAGKYKKTNLKTLEGDEITRPTKDMVREALFSSITVHNETLFLDLFAGSGAIGIEALSRGAKDVVFNDHNKEAVKIIRENLDKLKEERRIMDLEYADCLKQLKDAGFDFIYVDPPYAFQEYGEVFELVREYNVLDKKGIMIVEVRKDTQLPEYPGYSCFKERRYGICKLLYYRKEEKQ
ncbi:MAG: 16S rRNA (guanine(966)-N(2))-methyltransferase RsmD [Erysipelotrichaceae bacterium]|nr:16S rRNA (guanine(966)-N(2))-methyltransferase RsmD [Erysipelotrichaceae bacterium]